MKNKEKQNKKSIQKKQPKTAKEIKAIVHKLLKEELPLIDNIDDLITNVFFKKCLSYMDEDILSYDEHTNLSSLVFSAIDDMATILVNSRNRNRLIQIDAFLKKNTSYKIIWKTWEGDICEIKKILPHKMQFILTDGEVVNYFYDRHNISVIDDGFDENTDIFYKRLDEPFIYDQNK